MQIQVAKNNLKPKLESRQESSWPKIQKEQNNEVQVDMSLPSPEIQVKALNRVITIANAYMVLLCICIIYIFNIYKHIYFLYLILSGEYHCQSHFLDEDTSTKITGIPAEPEFTCRQSDSRVLTLYHSLHHLSHTDQILLFPECTENFND